MSISVQTPTDTTIVMSRSFSAPRDLVFAVHTQAEHLHHWWGRGNPRRRVGRRRPPHRPWRWRERPAPAVWKVSRRSFFRERA